MSTTLLIIAAWATCVSIFLCCLVCCAIWAGVSAVDLPRPDKHIKEKLKKAGGKVKAKLGKSRDKSGGAEGYHQP